MMRMKITTMMIMMTKTKTLKMNMLKSMYGLSFLVLSY